MFFSCACFWSLYFVCLLAMNNKTHMTWIAPRKLLSLACIHLLGRHFDKTSVVMEIVLNIIFNQRKFNLLVTGIRTALCYNSL